MLRDARHVLNGTHIDCDLCIVGGGAAGLTMARELAGGTCSVVLLEGGGLEVDGISQALYAGRNVGLPYERLTTARSRYLGGSTNCWGGFSRPLEPGDFVRRPWIPGSGWPIAREALMPYYERSQEVLGLGPFDYGNGFWMERVGGPNATLFPLDGVDGQMGGGMDGGDFENRVAQLSPPIRMGEAYRAEIGRAANITAFLNANVTGLETNATASAVERVRVRTLGGPGFTVGARLFVLCCGGIENARILLLSNGVQAAGLGNGNDLVGRCFADHPRFKTGPVRLTQQRQHRRLYDVSLCLARRRLRRPHPPVALALAPTAELQARHELPNSRTYLVASYHSGALDAFKAMRDLRLLPSRHRCRRFGVSEDEAASLLRNAGPRILRSLPQLVHALFDSTIDPGWLPRRFTLETVLEPVPNPDSRVTLDHATDPFGCNLPRVDWRLTDQDRRGAAETQRLLREELLRRGLISVDGDGEDGGEGDAERGAAAMADVGWCWHHMGTTRMHESPRHGVVDADGRVHGVGNLYVAGSSVFPTMGADHPTMTIVALALRLTDRVAALLQDERSSPPAPAVAASL
ncbi:FAD-dependent oxidoreductase [Azospirillum thiophilum]|uniref:FAD-dependent oxidoreductase n=1 Tax=Azospirillum thiophilum TaxID=528244 RepID=A0AAC8W4N1_9PROT|nr:GMC family oxidoreductase [Azospirillum thiophilum]ALG74952.1 FAD-dependent oxidoreductase [Azospirillum thiophilum]KJR62340.1 FAD-dependent oxidoreductase [Azospirillum thiophilum]